MSDFSFLLNAAALSAIILVMTYANGQRPERLWLIVHLAILAACALAYSLQIVDAGYVLFGISMVLVVLPFLLRRLGFACELRRRDRLAAVLYGLAALLHPTAVWRFEAARAVAMAKSGRFEKAAALKKLAEQLSPEMGFYLMVTRLRLLNDWEGLLRVPLPSSKSEGIDPVLLVIQVQALGETGNLDGMVELYFFGKPLLKQEFYLDQMLLKVLTMTGRFEAVDHMLTFPFSTVLTHDEKTWIAQLARLAAGRREAIPVLQDIIERERDPDLRTLMQKRLDTPLADPATLRPDLSARLDVEEKERLTRKIEIGLVQRTIPATYILIALNLTAFAYELWLGNPSSVDVLDQAGGLWLYRVTEEGQWWRLVSLMFLHAGWAHLVFNMAALLFIGRVVERRFGSAGMLAIYCLGGILSSSLVCYLMWQSIIRYGLLVGASGAVFALIGALVARIFVDWRRARSFEYRSSLTSLIALLVLQFFLDAVIPEVSMAAHLGGFFAGLMIGAILIFFRR